MSMFVNPLVANASETSWDEVAAEQERVLSHRSVAHMHELTFNDFSDMNKARCEHIRGFNHKLNSWSTSDWMTATMGELGEAANVIKKLNRVRDGIPGNSETEAELKSKLAEEIADSFIYLDLLAQSCGMRMEQIIRNKFHRTSLKIGYLSA